MKIQTGTIILFSFLLLYAPHKKSQILTLRKSEQLALEKNFDVQTARFELASAIWEQRGLFGNLLPTVSFQSNWFRSETPDDLPPGIEPPVTPGMPGLTPDGFFHQLSVTQPIFNGGTELVSLLMANSTLSALQFQLKAAGQDAILDARTNYLNTILLREQIHIDSMGIEWVRGNLEQARVRFEEGLLPISEILRWEAETYDREARYRESIALYEASLAMLLLIIGEEKLSGEDISLEGVELLERMYQQLGPVPDGRVEDNPSIIAAKERLRVSERAVLLSVTPFLPNINAFFNYDWPPGNGVIPQDEGTWSIGVQLNLTLFAGGSRYAQLMQSRNELRSAEAMTTQIIRQTSVNLHRSALLFRSSLFEAEAARSRVELMRRALSSVERRYQTGLASFLELLDTQIQTESALSAYLASIVNCITRQAEYLRAAGILEETR